VITLVLGGARSGKSVVAERLVARLPAPTTYVATAVIHGDADMAARVAVHRDRRPAGWRTVEASGARLAVHVENLEGSVLVDSLGPWVAGVPGFDVDLTGLCHALTERSGDTVIVSEEVGLGVHPTTDAGRRFRDVLGEVNQAVAAIADEVLLVVAGRTLRLDDPRLDDPRRGDPWGPQ
jgi:adenosylcobinamide kinase / adenosylcobinamide-phosphate guanylyltransferase